MRLSALTMPEIDNPPAAKYKPLDKLYVQQGFKPENERLGQYGNNSTIQVMLTVRVRSITVLTNQGGNPSIYYQYEVECDSGLITVQEDKLHRKPIAGYPVV